MIKVFISLLRDYKINLIYILLFTVMLLICHTFLILKDYYTYNINEVYGALEKNRKYIIETDDLNLINDLKENVDLEKIEKLSDYYYVVIRKYKDTSKLDNYLNNKNVTYYLAELTDNYELIVLEKNLQTFQVIAKFSVILTIICAFFLIKNLIITEEKNMALFTIIGYKKRNIYLILIFKILTILLLSIVLETSLIYLFHLSYLFIKDKVIKGFLKQLNIKYYFLNSFIIFIPIILNIIIYRIKKLNVFDILN